MIGFQSGYVIVISTLISEIGNEVGSGKLHKESLNHVAYSPVLQKGASVGDSCVKMFDMSDISDFENRVDKVELEGEFGSLERVAWTEDGQILTVSSVNGSIYSFLTMIPVLHDSYETRVVRRS